MKPFNSTTYKTEAEARAAYQNYCRWGGAGGPLGNFEQFLIASEASARSLSRGLSMATLEDYEEAAKLVRGA